MARIALLSDIHGNPIALDAVLADVRAEGGADAYWILGDLVGLGYDPVMVLERLVALPHVRFVRGNQDRYVAIGERPPPTPDEVRQDLSQLDTLIEIAQSFAWTQGAVTAAGWLDWLAALPLEQRLTLPDGTRLLGVHASPGRDGTRPGDGIVPTTGEAELQSLLDGCGADLVCVGHTHWPLERRAGGVHLVNLGSVSNPFAPDLRASYVLLDADERGYRVQHRRVEYDRGATVAALRRVRHPAAAFIASFMLGQRRPGWARG